MFLIKFHSRIYIPLQVLFLFGLILSACNNNNYKENDVNYKENDVASKDLPEVRYIEPNPETGFSLATIVKDVPLTFTNQLFPFDENGNVIGSSDLIDQLDQVLKNAEIVLKAVGTDLSSLVRIHLYLKDDTMSEEVLKRLKEILPDNTFPAITYISGDQPRPNVLVSMDIVAVTSEQFVKERVSLYHPEGIFGQPKRTQIAVLAPGRKIFISGQAEMGEDLSNASLNTMRNLFATLAYLGAKAEDVVQIKAFFNPIDDAKSVEEDIASFFHGKKVPPIISVEWVNDLNRVEIELIVSAKADSTTNDEVIKYYAPAWMTQATTFSRIVDIKNGGLFFTSGLYGEGEDGQMQARKIFETIGRILEKSGSSYNYLVKATYYPSSEDGHQGFVSVRPEFYNPNKPPAASLIRVKGTGREKKNINVDLIGLIPE